MREVIDRLQRMIADHSQGDRMAQKDHSRKSALADSESCINKAADDEPIFVLRAKDPLAALMVAKWSEYAATSGLHEPHKCSEAAQCAWEMTEWRRQNCDVVSAPTMRDLFAHGELDDVSEGVSSSDDGE